MAAESIQPLSQQTQHDGSVTANTRLTPKDDRIRGSMVVPPTTVVPVIFVPGIMGSNLRDKHTKASVWNTNSTLSILLQWIFRSARTRQSKLVAQQAEVDPTGKWYGRSATIPDEAAAEKRGEGTTSRAFYGDFVVWLDNQLSGLAAATASGVPSPWKAFEGKDFAAEWHAEKPFQTLTHDESDKAWDNFYCPVHVQGYNWLQSNGESGKELAKVIDQVIAFWNGKQDGAQAGGPTFKCEQVILVSHSMGGLVTRAAVHPKFGNAADKVLGIVHGEQPANGAAAAYHHCRSGYGGVSGWVLGRNAAQVTAVFANSPGAMELLPNQQYPKGWLKARVGDSQAAVMELPKGSPYAEIYTEKDKWWRLVDPNLIDPSGKITNPWYAYNLKITSTAAFHASLGTEYHHLTYIHYGADTKAYPAFGDLVWHSDAGAGVTSTDLLVALPTRGSNPVSVFAGAKLNFAIVDPEDVGYPQPGDGTVPDRSGAAPKDHSQSVLTVDVEHEGAFRDSMLARQFTLSAIVKIAQAVKQTSLAYPWLAGKA